MKDSPYLLSGGNEGVVVQWNVETLAKTFISRLGNSIERIALSEEEGLYYSLILGDNSFKVVRFDNNKPVLTVQNFKTHDLSSSVVADSCLVSANGGDLHWVNLLTS